ncbi:uncharacterized protein LOC111311638 isoform X2 [Durio zibethinus]|uniref:Uncharacterized protein LOC111311638 isoform X2 n=1 Tax=Durio zibethinus TaxID=66656 RepID=A0A6P6AQ62_DURZI|nr:uncharacterized protein LOC111311638 isoform X2 [Durio zibethinus]
MVFVWFLGSCHCNSGFVYFYSLLFEKTPKREDLFLNMVWWQRHLQCALRQVGRRLEHNYTPSAHYSSTSRLSSSLLPCELPSIRRLWRSPSASISTPLYQYFQQFLGCLALSNDEKNTEGISTSRKLLAGSSEETPISSPLTPVLAIDGGKTEEKKVVPSCSKVQAVLKKIKQVIHSA